MGQYWYPVNLDKKEYVCPHKLGSGLKLWEQLANHPGTGGALVVLCAAMTEPRGGGDFDMEDNWHGEERTFPTHNANPGPMPDDYPSVAKRTIGRWAGDRIAFIGDYAEPGDIPGARADLIYGACQEGGCDTFDMSEDDRAEAEALGEFADISEDVCRVLEHELQGEFQGDGWRDFVRK